MKRVILSGHILVSPLDLDVVRRELPLHIKLTRLEPGNLIFVVSEHTTVSGRFDVYEEFVDRNAFEAHQDRVRASKWGEVTGNVERHYRIEERA